MALFGFGKKDSDGTDAPQAEVKVTSATKKVAPKKKKAVAVQKSTPRISAVAHVLRNPRITEKATMQGNVSAYLFDVAESATKHEIKQAITALYKVTPRMIHVVTVPAKKKRNSRTGRVGIKTGGKKAYIYLTKGETITLS